MGAKGTSIAFRPRHQNYHLISSHLDLATSSPHSRSHRRPTASTTLAAETHLPSTIIAALLSATSSLAQPTGSGDSCATNKPINTSYNETYDSIRISKGVVCGNATAAPNYICPLQSWAYVSYSTRFNVSLSSVDERNALMDFLAPSDLDPVRLARDGISGIVANETLLVPRGYNAYVKFAEAHICHSSYLSPCTGLLASLSDTYIEACVPVYNTGNGSIPMFFKGRGFAYNISAEEARSLTDYGPYSKNMSGEYESVTGPPYSGGLGDGIVGADTNGSGIEAGAPGVEQQMGNGASGLGVSAFAIAVTGAAVVLGA